MFRLRASINAQSAVRLCQEALAFGRSGSVTYRPVGYGLTICPSVFAGAAARQYFTSNGPAASGMPSSAAAMLSTLSGCKGSSVASSGFRFTRGGGSVQAGDVILTSVFGRRLGTMFAQYRHVRVNGKADGDAEAKNKAEGGEQETSEGEKSEEEEKDGKKKKKKKPAQKKTLGDQIRSLKEDVVKFPDIYNSANLINFIIFTVFCICSTGSSSEEQWWLTQWGLDNTMHPLSWILHSFLTNNFLSMTFAMMLLHTMCHAVLPSIGSRGLLIYVCATALISGVIMFIGNRLYYGDKPAPEKQFGPWDVISALFVMEYLLYGVTPINILNSFNGWLRYACWVGEICILYFDWQPTLVGTFVGLALCKGHPRFRAMKAPGA